MPPLAPPCPHWPRSAIWAGLLAATGAACGSGESSPSRSSSDECSSLLRLGVPADIERARACESITGNVWIAGSEMTSLAGLETIPSIGGALRIFDTSLTDLSGLSGLTHVEGNLDVETNPRLREAALGGLSQVGGLTVSGNSALERLEFSSLTDVGGTLIVDTNASLQSLEGLGSLARIGGNLMVQSNGGLSALSGLGALETIAGDLLVRDNPRLLSVSLPALRSVGVAEPEAAADAPGPSPAEDAPTGHQLYVAENPSLTRIDVPELRAVGSGGVRLFDNGSLSRCDAEALARQVGSRCDCSGNRSVESCEP